MHVPTLQCSLAAPGFDLARALQWALAAVVVCSFLIAGWYWRDSQDLDEQAARLEASAGRIQEASRRFTAESLREGFDLSPRRTRTLAQEISFSRQVAEQHAFSWTQFLSALEETVPPRVSVNSISVTPKTAMVSLSGSALSLVDVTAFVNALDGHPAFLNANLSQHRVQEKEKDRTTHAPTRPVVEFTLTVTYRHPAG